MYVTEFIGRHFPCFASVEKVTCQCKLCGKDSEFGVSGLISDTFTDQAYFQNPKSDVLCRECATVLGKIINPATGKITFFRNFSFLCIESELKLLKREDILSYILNPPVGRFVLCVTYNNKKHMAFKSRIQGNRDFFTVTTDTGDIKVDRELADKIISVIQSWYSVVPDKADTKAQPTWFTKVDILAGCVNYKKIETYGLKKFFAENQQIELWRGTGLLKLLVFCLNKRI